LIGNAGEDLGQGPEFIDWPTFPGLPADLLLPRSRSGDALSATSGVGISFYGEAGDFNYYDSFTGNLYQVAADWYQLTLPLEAYWNYYTTLSITDSTVGDTSQSFSVSSYGQSSLQSWHPSAQLLLKISATRFNNALQIRCANGEIIPITKHRVQGDWSIDSNGQSWFNSYGYFDATAQYRLQIPWHLYDATRGEYLSDIESPGGVTDFTSATDNTDSDQDGLADWYEHMIGTDPNDPDTDHDGDNDAVEVANGTNPRAGSATGNPNATLIVFTPLE
jgi:hypothetical protein